MLTKEEIGFKFMILRKSEKYKQKPFAIKLGTNQTAISNIECGKDLPSIEILIKLKDLYDISIDDFLYNHTVSYK